MRLTFFSATELTDGLKILRALYAVRVCMATSLAPGAQLFIGSVRIAV